MSNKYTFREITIDEYYSLSSYQRLIEFTSADKFWSLEISKRKYGFGIDSKLMIEPLVFYFDNEGVIFIGLHDKIIAFSCENGRIEFLSSLWDTFSSVEKIHLGYLVITETTLLKINENTFSLDSLTTFPDVIEKYEISGDNIKVTGVTGEVFNKRL